MRILQKNPRTLRPNKFIDTRAKTGEDIDSLQTDRLSKVETLKTDPLEFFRQILGVELTDYEKANQAFPEESVYGCPFDKLYPLRILTFAISMLSS